MMVNFSKDPYPYPWFNCKNTHVFSGKKAATIPDDIWDVVSKTEVTNLNFSKNVLSQWPDKSVVYCAITGTVLYSCAQLQYWSTFRPHRAQNIENFSLACLPEFCILFKQHILNLEESFVKSHLPSWHFCLPGTIRQWNWHHQGIIKHVNSFPLSAAYMRRWTGSALVQVMASCLFLAPSHYLNQCSLIVNWTLRNKLQWN